MTPADGGQSLIDFLDRLDGANAHYTLTRVREGTVMVEVAVPGERWEIEFFDDDHVEVERFRSDGTISDETVFAQLVDFFREDEREL